MEENSFWNMIEENAARWEKFCYNKYGLLPVFVLSDEWWTESLPILLVE